MARLNVRLEGVYLARADGFAAGDPLIARAAVNRLELMNCTLDPGGFKRFNGSRAPILPSIELHEPYGFSGAEDALFKQTPEIVSRERSRPILIDSATACRWPIRSSMRARASAIRLRRLRSQMQPIQRVITAAYTGQRHHRGA
jgi:hypothetical protein